MPALDASLLEDPVPVFPLPNCVLTPHALLPLHVFEPRYRRMTLDLIDKPVGKRLLAIALLRGEYDAVYHTNHAPIHPVVGLGEVVQCNARPDGCFDILVLGRCRARIEVEDTTGVYRNAVLKMLPTEPDDFLTTVDDAVDEARSLIEECDSLGLFEPTVIHMILRQAPTTAAMIDLGAFHLLGVQETAVKQRILEEEDLARRARLLAAHLRALVQSSRQAQRGDSPPWPPHAHSN